MIRRTLPLLALLSACDTTDEVVTVLVETWGLALEPIVPEGQDPFSGGALTVSLTDADGTTLYDLGSSDDATWSVHELDALDGAVVGLLVTDPGTRLDPLDLSHLRAYGQTDPIDLDEGDDTRTVLLPGYARVGEVGALTGAQVSLGAAAAMLPDGDVFVFGGTSTILGTFDEPAAKHVLYLDRADDDLRVERVGDLPTFPNSDAERVGATATVVQHQGRPHILVAGGRRAWTPAGEARPQAFLFDPESRTPVWDATLPEDRSQHVAIPVGDRVYLLGGFDESGTSGDLTWDVWIGGDTPRFERGGTAEVKDIGFGWAALDDGTIVLCGGGARNPVSSALDPVETCRRILPNGDVGSLTGVGATGGPGVPRMFHTMTPLPGGKILVAGGVDFPVAPGGTREALDTAWLLDPSPPGTWESVGPMRQARAMHTAIPLPDGRVMLVGGVREAFGPAPLAMGQVVPCPEVFDPADDTFTLLEDCPDAGEGALLTVASDPAHGVFVLQGATPIGGGEAWGVVGLGPAWQAP